MFVKCRALGWIKKNWHLSGMAVQMFERLLNCWRVSDCEIEIFSARFYPSFFVHIFYLSLLS
uniref:Uncharacterized protein n=1 Tax=Rhizophora mucronata TaxID=61149 RepID=A0A2P2Q6B2_RHIMU